MSVDIQQNTQLKMFCDDVDENIGDPGLVPGACAISAKLSARDGSQRDPISLAVGETYGKRNGAEFSQPRRG